MIDIHQNLGFVKTFLCWRSRVIDNHCKISVSNEIFDNDQFIIFRDASFGTCSYNLSLMDVLNGLYKVHNVTVIQTKNCGEILRV